MVGIWHISKYPTSAVYSRPITRYKLWRCGDRTDFLRRQVLSSRNLHGSLLLDYFYGGLNYQIEHHLFPSMPRWNLRLAQPIVREFCKEHDIPYIAMSFLYSLRRTTGYLRALGELATRSQPANQ